MSLAIRHHLECEVSRVGSDNGSLLGPGCVVFNHVILNSCGLPLCLRCQTKLQDCSNIRTSNRKKIILLRIVSFASYSNLYAWCDGS